MNTTMTAIYGGGPFYSGGQPVIADLKQSGFTTVVEWGLQLSAATSGPTVGDLQLNEVIVSGGQYVGDPHWPAALASLKQGSTSVNRLLFSILGFNGGTFPTIQALIQQQGTGPDSILYKNFQALKQAIPTIDGIDLDDETLYDPDTTVQLSRMLGVLGYQVTFCPFDNAEFWVDCLSTLEARNPGLVTGFNLQCYAGGGGNSPGPWIDAIAAKMGPGFPASSFVYPGLWCRNGDGCAEGSCPSDITAQFAGWQSTGIQGGFIWLYDDVQKCEGSAACGTGAPMDAAAYAGAIVQGLQPQAAAAEAAPPVAAY